GVAALALAAAVALRAPGPAHESSAAAARRPPPAVESVQPTRDATPGARPISRRSGVVPRGAPGQNTVLGRARASRP
ncbi:MAG TPA: hypothetical protein VFG23_06790, partial [Polyangia bacterium]|nr:hypothetical protein [Polyangia bacterium]